jgi:hypothetical protein
MKTNLSLRLALCGAVALFTHATFGQTWQTVDDFQLVPGYQSIVQAMAKDPSGNLYAAGYAVIDAKADEVAVIKKSSDGGATWSVMDAFSHGAAKSWVSYSGITSDAAGTLYAAGYDSYTPNGSWFVRRSLDGGLTWQTVDTLNLSVTASPHAVATDAAGNVFVAGADHGSWIVRKSADGGNSWSTTDSFNPGNGAYASGVFCHPTAGIFVAGYGTATSGTGRRTTTQQYWYVRRSLNGGATWTTVDAYVGGTANGIGADASGNIHAVGYNGTHWIVRKSVNGGTSWATVDDFLLCVTTTSSTKPYGTQTYCYNAYAHGFGADANGNLFVAGHCSSAAGTQWLVRANPGGTGSWQTVDTFQYTAGGGNVAFSVVGDNSGHVFVGGWASSATGGHWLVRKFPAP